MSLWHSNAPLNLTNMEFRTKIKIDADGTSIKHDHPVMMIGSCFSDNIGARLADAMMNVSINPLGTVYNPFSVAQAIDRIILCRKVERNELFLANGVWNCFDFHSRFSHADADDTLQGMNDSIVQAHNHLKHCRALFVTLGTAITYNHSGDVVSNCHKLPASDFLRKMRNVSEITDTLDSMIQQLHEFNPNLKIIFTVSPIRHIADGLATNNLSKSTLRVAIAQSIEKFPDFCGYFPSYEILIDDLRDYRFYASDMVHPSDVAVDYIWELLKTTYFDAQTQQLIDRCERLTKRLRHRPMSDNADLIEKFRSDTQDAITSLTKQYPHIAEILNKRF